jgi:hypothetical protein
MKVMIVEDDAVANTIIALLFDELEYMDKGNRVRLLKKVMAAVAK